VEGEYMPNPDLDDQSQRALLWLKRVDSLPPFPAVIQETLSLLDSDRSNASDIARAVSKDEAITARILRVVNSAFYGARGKVTTVSHAVTLLGLEQLRMVVMGVALLDQGDAREPGATWNRKMVWEHSWASARWAQALAWGTRYEPAEEASIAALLHDVGKIVIGASEPREFTEAVALASTTGLVSWEAEDRVVGFNHVETGKLVAERWRFPAAIHQTIALHHSAWPLPIDAGDAGGRRLVHLLAIAKVANGAAKESLGEQPHFDAGRDTAFPISSPQLAAKVADVDLLLRM
jgi:putative nucleotidyltransferase with HDIG domain